MQLTINERHRIYFQALIVVVAFILLGEPFARSDSFIHRSIYIAILLSFFGGNYLLAYELWPIDKGNSPDMKRIGILAILFAAVSLLIWQPVLSRFPGLEYVLDKIALAGNGYAAFGGLILIYLVMLWARRRGRPKSGQ